MTRFQFTNGLKSAAPVILGIGASVGVVLTAIQVAKDTPKAMEKLEEAKAELGRELTFIEKVKVAAPVYLPSILTGTATIACITGGAIVSQKGRLNSAVLAAGATEAYNYVSKKLDEKTPEKEDVTDQISTGSLELYRVPFYGFFYATRETVLNGFLKINELLAENSGVTVYDFLIAIGIDKHDVQAKACSMLGWSSDYLLDENEKINIKGRIIDSKDTDELMNGDHFYDIDWEVPPIVNPWSYDPYDPVDGEHAYGLTVLEDPKNGLSSV